MYELFLSLQKLERAFEILRIIIHTCCLCGLGHELVLCRKSLRLICCAAFTDASALQQVMFPPQLLAFALKRRIISFCACAVNVTEPGLQRPALCVSSCDASVLLITCAKLHFLCVWNVLHQRLFVVVSQLLLYIKTFDMSYRILCCTSHNYA